MNACTPLTLGIAAASIRRAHHLAAEIPPLRAPSVIPPSGTGTIHASEMTASPSPQAGRAGAIQQAAAAVSPIVAAAPGSGRIY